MNFLAALLIADSVRARIEQGDCPTEPQQPRELVEESLCELQRAIARDAVAIEFVALKAQRDALLESLEEMTPAKPGSKGFCHAGIVAEEKCANCQRIARAHAAIKTAKGKA